MTLASPTHPLSLSQAIASASLFPLTIDQYHQMIAQGIVPEDSTVELLHGILVRKDRSSPGDESMGHSPLHRLVLTLLTALAAKINSPTCHMQIQCPVRCPPDSEPEPDAAIIRGSPRDYAARLPSAADVTCIIEVAHSSLDRDREDKLPLYAAAAIPQYIIINLQTTTIELHTNPDPTTQTYRANQIIRPGQSLDLILPSTTFSITANEILP